MTEDHSSCAVHVELNETEVELIAALTAHSSPANAEPELAVARAIVHIRELFQSAPFLATSETPIGGCGLVSFCDLRAIQEYAGQQFEADGIRAQQMRIPDGCDWPNEPFTFHDEPGEHDPCYVIMPGGAMLPLNHHAGEGVDIARAKFIVAACNAALSHDFPREIVAEAMQDAWNTICSDTGCHPLDIEQRGKKLFFSPGHWVDLIALFLGDHPAFTSPESQTVTPSCGCVFCDIEGDLHEDATGFHHVVNGERVPCTRGQP